ncbi:prolipoprotein diacylglyceryl transferase [Nereida ignava]|jgi:phosphatidylglycerol:prolipoprotein diacylglycerol transferase|uniref:prolipoprotein diacylglyceryl transferase n=1 Tax=Nereida ignava TaxID=282199 RepID=UPI003F6A9C5C
MIGTIPFPDIGPNLFAIDIAGIRFALRWYALAYIVGILVGWRLCIMALRRPKLWARGDAPTSTDIFGDLVSWLILGVILGGRLGFVLFYQPEYYLTNPAEILKVWQGGMSFHGGFIGVSVAALIFCLKYKIPLLPMADLLALATPPGLLLGRIANFINAELWGRPTTVPWGVVFPGAAAQDCGEVAGLCARHPSQLYEAALEGALLGFVLIVAVFGFRAFRRSGLITGIFLIGYGASRAFVELFRQPDVQFVTIGNPIGHALHFGDWGLTMGQILSLPMVLVGVILVVLAVNRTATVAAKENQPTP